MDNHGIANSKRLNNRRI